MRTNNEKIKNIIISVYFILIVLAILLAVVFSAFKGLTPNPLLTFIVITLVLALLFGAVHKISRYFEYDSDGQELIIINRGLLLADYFNYREHKLELEKRKLTGFKFYNLLFYNWLTIYYNDSKGNRHKENFNVTTVSKKKRKYIRQSLSKIIKENKKNNLI